MEPLSVDSLVAIAGAFGGAEMATKLLGPTLEYFGNGLKGFTEKRITNVKSILAKAAKRFPSEVKQPLVPTSPNLVKKIFDYGSYAEDELIQEYLAGLLISSRVGLENDDRSSVLANIIENMSVYQIRAHYLIYSLFRKKYLGTQVSLNIQANRANLQFYIPYSIFAKYVFPSEEERQLSNGLVDHAIYGLVRNYLLEQNLVIGSPQHISMELHTEAPNEHGIVIQPSPFGIELFLWISSIGKTIQMNMLLDPAIEIPDLIDYSSLDMAKVYRCPN